MKFQIFRAFKFYFIGAMGISLAFHPFLSGIEFNNGSSIKNPLQEVASLGAPTTGSLVEGVVGSIHRGCRHRFYCHSSAADLGFLGAQTDSQTSKIKDQPGVFPAPVMGSASLIFSFQCQTTSSLTPIVVRPDGTVYQGHQMNSENSPQTVVVSSPAQTGIYTLFVLSNEKDSKDLLANVEAVISTQPQQTKSFKIKSLETDHKDPDQMSAEFIYTPIH